MKILLLEDDLELCKNIKISLEKENYMVDCCNDGETAMLYALNTDYAYDLAIVDRMLPIIDGLTIIKSMRKSGKLFRAVLIRKDTVCCTSDRVIPVTVCNAGITGSLFKFRISDI